MDNMRGERREFGRWWMWVLGLMILSGLIFTLLGYAGIFTKTVVEREVFEKSFQYSEARKSEIATYEAQLAEINSQLADPALDENTRRSLKSQKSAIEVRLTAAKTKQ